MILDTTLETADALELDQGAPGTYLLGLVTNLGPVEVGEPRELNGGADKPLYLVIGMDTAAASEGDATAQFLIVSDAQAAIATDGSATVHAATGAIPVSRLVSGYRVCAMPLPAGEYEQFLGVLQVTGAAAFTAGKVNVFLTMNPGKYTALPNALGVL